MLKLTFHGAAREVTGSMHLIEADGKLIALDCGMFQGRREESTRKNVSFPFDAKKLHAVVLSHAHIDHCGRLPLLAQKGFEGRIHSTAATRDLCGLLLRDAAHIQEEDTKYLNRKREQRGESPVMPLFNTDDALAALSLFQSVSMSQTFWVTRRLKARFIPTGHMLGAAMVLLEYERGDGQNTSLLFRVMWGGSICRSLLIPRRFQCDYLICESTYGGRRHPPTDDLKGQLEKIINDTVKRGGKIIIPAFSIGRTQLIVYFLHQLIVEGRIPTLPIYVDSPLAVNATEVFRLHPDEYDSEARRFQKKNGDLLGTDIATYIRDVEESKAIHRRRRPAVIISASGMCEAGRILHHLKNNIRSHKNTVLIVGFQAAHTLGRRIVEKSPEVRIFGKMYKVKAAVETLNGLSAHADSEELSRLYRPIASGCKQAFLVHGEPDQMTAMLHDMKAAGFRDVQMPSPGQSLDLNGG
ncbi:MAG: MBL fold metallo-hydrolase [Planctomycetes bacterium]|nr:MBL fold metallo-hydrolase [Planctomycetota bacterium]